MNEAALAGMNKVTLTTDEFWKKMCATGFFRISLHQGALGNDLFEVEVAPEQVPGFFESVIGSIVSNLNIIPIPLEQDTLLA